MNLNRLRGNGCPLLTVWIPPELGRDLRPRQPASGRRAASATGKILPILGTFAKKKKYTEILLRDLLGLPSVVEAFDAFS